MDDDKSKVLYRKMYFGLFRAVTEALEAMEQQNFGAAADRLRRGSGTRRKFLSRGTGRAESEDSPPFPHPNYGADSRARRPE